ncbi:MAG TPA: CHAT domain-containing protein, partial [Thermoanaerobaculia bacterium]|nr:CHAT domain-containing protein [Thermoanaerobaculia bacterium]
ATSYHYRLGQALYERALAEDSLGRSNEAERDLVAAIAESELQREKIMSLEDRISYFDRTREIFDTMIWFQLERRQRPEVAFRYSEQAKARVLQDWLLLHPVGGPVSSRVEGTGQGFLNVASLQEHLSQDTAVVEYAVLPKRLVIWVLRRTDFKVETVAIDAKDLGDLVRGLIRALKEGRKADFLKTSSKLHEVLVRPVAGHLGPGDRIVTIPDGALHTLSFALLRDGRTGRYLVQDHVLSTAPSARIMVTSLQRDESLTRQRDPRALVVVDPAFDQALYSLPRLRGAETEAVIARIFPDSEVLSDRDATRSAFLRLAGDYEMIHFGGHSLVNTEFPLLSQMLFAGDPEDPTRGVLYSGDILKQRFERTRLAVLASCSTAVGRISRTEGVENLARPFLAAGVPAVIASLWDVDDQVTADFFMRFYRHLGQGFDVAGALRATQIESIEHGSGHAADPLAWGAFEVIGANSPSRIEHARGDGKP